MDHNLIELAAQVVSGYVSNNPVQVSDLAELIRNVAGAIGGLADGASPGMDGTGLPKREPAVTIKKSITPDFLICLEDGKKLKMLKRYLRSRFKLTPDQYRTKWGLPADYPMVASNYAAKRSEFAKKIGLGRTPARTPARKKVA